MRKSILIIVIGCLYSQATFAQLVVVPIARTPGKTSKRISARQQLTPMVLPFWDDFSFSNSAYYPHDTLWQNGSAVSLNFGIGIDPPSLGVVTFDGLDSLGKPYDVNNALSKGFADSLESRPIRLDLVPSALRTTVYLSFYYQFEGNGEVPDTGDHLNVEFKNDQDQWETIATIASDGSLPSDVFNTMLLPVPDRFFHGAFQFRFRNFGRLSGPYDTWNVDYVYLNSGRSPTDTSFPDRAIATPLTSLFNEYWAIPKKHFMLDIQSNLSKPSFDIYNLSDTVDQPLNYSYYVEVISYQDSIANSSGPVQLEDITSLSDILPLTRKTGTVATTPPVNLFDPAADSFRIKLKLGLRTKDNLLKPPDDFGDYDSSIYKPIDFRVNDTTRSEFTLAKSYAYDDGSAEYGIGLNQPGAQVAYLFEMKTPEVDTIVAVDFYFPRFGDESNQIILLRILSDTTDNQQSILYEEIISVNRSELNRFKRHILTRNTVLVQGSFYLCWKQNSSGVIPIGWDKNTDSGDKISFNTNGSWEPNLIEHGSMMIHPVFGKGGVVTGLPAESTALHAFPNPNPGIFFLSEVPEYINLFDLAGKPVGFSSETQNERTKIVMNNPYPGIFILKTLTNKKYATQKIMVRP